MLAEQSNILGPPVDLTRGSENLENVRCLSIPAGVPRADESEYVRQVVDWLLLQPHYLDLVLGILQDPQSRLLIQEVKHLHTHSTPIANTFFTTRPSNAPETA